MLEITNIGNRVRERRKELNLTLEQLAEKIDLSTNFIENIERGDSVPSIETFVKLANALSVNADYLCRDLITNYDPKLQNNYNYYIDQVIEKMLSLKPNQQETIANLVDSISKHIIEK